MVTVSKIPVLKMGGVKSLVMALRSLGGDVDDALKWYGIRAII